MPWIREQWGSVDTDYYVGVKTSSTYANLTADSQSSKLSVDEVQQSLYTHVGSRIRHLEVLEEDHLARPGYWHYAPMFASMQRVLYACLIAISKGSQYDWVVLQRTDVLLGPDPSSLTQILPDRPEASSVWTVNGNMPQIYGEARSGGVYDMLLAGSPQAMNLLISGTFEATTNAKTTDWKKFFFTGPNVFLRSCADQANLNLENLRVAVAVVRPGQHLNIPVFQSFEHHRRFWIESHKGMS